ncbi:MAG: hypothetical protein ABS75_28315 [Pelagibacterium sp. SCN 63-23]|nr:MAG: hypothetical protein ABS75_28315 [Pelagibacterium sp. SCN 63-23]
MIEKEAPVRERLGKITASLPAWRRNRRRVAVWASLGLVCIAAFSALMLFAGIARQIDDVTHSHQTLIAARELAHALSRAEASQRGFFLTEGPEFARDFDIAAAQINLRVDELRGLTAEDAGQSMRLERIAEDIAEELRVMELSMAQVSAAGQGDARVDAGMDALGVELEGFIALENRKIATGNAEMGRTRIGLVGALIAALLAAALLASTLLMRTQRQKGVLEAQIAERMREIEQARAHAERERQRVETLLQDTNHRVGNSLATVSSLLALQAMRNPPGEVQDALEAARLRIHAIASAHRRLRLGDDMETASAEEFLGAVVEDIAETQPDSSRVALTSHIEPIDVRSRDATTLGILVGELVTNALKHAFPDGRAGEIEVRLFRDDADVPTLSVRDDGVGLSANQSSAEGGLGSLIVRQLAGQFDGEPHYQSVATGGVCITVPLPGLTRISSQSLEL